MESEKTAKWQYTRHCEELGTEIKKLREEVGLALLIFGTFPLFHKLILSQCSCCKTFQLFTLKKEWRLLPQQQLSTQ